MSGSTANSITTTRRLRMKSSSATRLRSRGWPQQNTNSGLPHSESTATLVYSDILDPAEPAAMQPTFPCPNPACTHTFSPNAVKGASSLVCPRCGTVFHFGPSHAAPTRPGGAMKAPPTAAVSKPPASLPKAPPPALKVAAPARRRAGGSADRRRSGSCRHARRRRAAAQRFQLQLHTRYGCGAGTSRRREETQTADAAHSGSVGGRSARRRRRGVGSAVVHSLQQESEGGG